MNEKEVFLSVMDAIRRTEESIKIVTSTPSPYFNIPWFLQKRSTSLTATRLRALQLQSEGKRHLRAL